MTPPEPHATLRTRLTNGAHVAITPVLGARSVSLIVASRIGSGFESPAEQGISHFVEHMLFKGTASRPSYTEIAASIERLGGQLNAITEPEMTVLWAKVAPSHWRTAVELLGDMVARSRFDAGEVGKERGVILDELGTLNDVPEEKVRRSVRARLWPDHGLGREVAGRPRNVQGIAPDQLRAHARRMFAGANLVLSAAGDLDQPQVLAGFEQEFGSLPTGRVAGWPKFRPNGLPKPRVVIDDRDGDQVLFAIAGRTLRREDPDRYAMDILCAAIGEGMGSRLFEDLRESRGIVYEVFSALFVARDSGAMTIEAATDPDRLPEAMEAVLRQLGAIRRDGISASELERAREFIKGEILLSMEDTYAVAAWSAREHLLETEQLSPEQVVAKYDEVELEDLPRVARRVFNKRWAIVAASGPLDPDTRLPVGFDGATAKAS